MEMDKFRPPGAPKRISMKLGIYNYIGGMTTCLYTRYNRLLIDRLYRVNGALVINGNLPTILHRFRDTAFDKPRIATFGYPSCLTPPAEGLPWDDLRKIFRGCQRMAKVPNAVEKLPKITTD